MICKKLFGYGIGLTRDIENIRQMKMTMELQPIMQKTLWESVVGFYQKKADL